MLSIALYSSHKSERAVLEQKCRALLAQASDEDAALLCCDRLEEMEQALLQADAKDIVCLDITEEGGISAAEHLRSHDARMLLVLIVNEDMSPRAYLRPTILAASILFRPFQQQEAAEVLGEVFRVWKEQNGSDADQFVFSVSGETRRIPHADILYFEAREKRVFLRTRHTEYGFYETMEHLDDMLPEVFLRCHKSYIVNMAYLRSLNLAKSMLSLDESGIIIPVSRTYKPVLKAWREDCV